MSKKEAGIIGIIGAGILGLGLLFGLGGKKKAEDNPNNIIGSSAGAGIGSGYNNPIIGGSSAGAGIGSGEATKPGAPYVIVNPPIVYGGGGGADIVSEAPNPDFNKNNIDGADNSVDGQNSTPEGWRIKEISSPKGGFKAINDITGKQIWTTQTPEEFIEDTSDPDSKYYDPQTSAGVASALKLYEDAPVKTTESSGDVSTSEDTPTPAHAEPEKMPDFGRGIVAYKARQAWQREHGGQ